MKNTLIINLLGGPGSAKSTMMASLFAELKWHGIDCEMVTEYAKDLVWEESFKSLDNQFHVSATQYKRLKRMEGKVDIVITDSPLILGIIYGKKEPEDLSSLILKYHNTFSNLNIFLDRKKKYNPNGRVQNEQEAIEKDGEILEMFTDLDIPYFRFNGDKGSVPLIMEFIMDYISKGHPNNLDNMEKNRDRKSIVQIYSKRLDKYEECSYGSFLDIWSNNDWIIV